MDEPMIDDPARDDLLILVDARDREIGSAKKLEAHLEGRLHRAFSVILWREGPDGVEVLLSRRALGKYHSGGLWANSCCSHPRIGETVLDAAARRTHEELGCGATGLVEIGTYCYRAAFDNGLVEYEYDHVLLGSFEGELAPDPSEVMDTRWVLADELTQELAQDPERFSAWAPGVLAMALAQLSRS